MLHAIAAGLHALIYSGDHDMAVPHTGSEAWTSSLRLQELTSWRPWYTAVDTDSERQVAGYVVEYEGLTYATVKGAGHMVPQNKPKEALELFRRFIRGEAIHLGGSSKAAAATAAAMQS